MTNSVQFSSCKYYYPFGMVMPGRKYTKSGGDYRFGFNGMEKDGEAWSGSVGNQLDFGARIYDSRLGRFLSTDPWEGKYAWQTPYAYFKNSPISVIDFKGLGGVGDDNDKGDGGGANVSYQIDAEKAGTSAFVDGEYITYVVDKYEQAILEGRFSYTKNYGWVDNSHAFTPSQRKNVGAINLWENINGGSSNVPAPDGSGELGFLVSYRQDAKFVGLLPPIGLTATYWVKNNLSADEKRSAAVAIFQQVSFMFEHEQSAAALMGRGDSSFELSDLPSNMLGMYYAMFENLNKKEILRLIEPYSPQESAQAYRESPGIFSGAIKNYTFKPIILNYSSVESGQVPEMLQNVQPAKVGEGENVMQFIIKYY